MKTNELHSQVSWLIYSFCFNADQVLRAQTLPLCDEGVVSPLPLLDTGVQGTQMKVSLRRGA